MSDFIRPLKAKNGRRVALYVGAGANQSWQFTRKDADGDAEDVSGLTIKMSVRNEPGSTTELGGGPITATLTTPTSGIITFAMSSFTFTVPYDQVILTIYIDAGSSVYKPLLQYSLPILAKSCG